MYALETHKLHCPYCGELIEVVVDCSEVEQSYIEDCFVCCRPIQFTLHQGEDGELRLRAQHEDE